MKLNSVISVVILLLAAASVLAAKPSAPAISGNYLEVRSCDVYTGPCFANAEMGLMGKEGILVWSVREGAWKGTSLRGLSVIAVLRADGTLGDLRYQPRRGKAVLIVDAKANAEQQTALADLARSLAGSLIAEVADIKPAKMEVALGTCSQAGCASVKAGNLVEISTRCLGGKDHLCGNEETFYPPLTKIQNALPAFAELAAYKGDGLGLTWEATEHRSAFLGAFSN